MHQQTGKGFKRNVNNKIKINHMYVFTFIVVRLIYTVIYIGVAELKALSLNDFLFAWLQTVSGLKQCRRNEAS